ncbi:hypothetical protein V8E36_000453 [Tilletia maclaganii]
MDGSPGGRYHAPGSLGRNLSDKPHPQQTQLHQYAGQQRMSAPSAHGAGTVPRSQLYIPTRGEFSTPRRAAHDSRDEWETTSSENDGHSQFSQGLAAHGGRSALYDDDDESDGMNDDDDVRMDEDEEEDSSPRPGSHIKALLDNDDGAGEDAEASTSPREMKGARWRGWELKLLIRNMHDLSVLDPNLTAKERMEVWQQIAELQTQAHGVEEHGVVPAVTFPELPGSSGPIPREPGARSDFLTFYVVYQILTEYGAAPLKFERSAE